MSVLAEGMRHSRSVKSMSRKCVAGRGGSPKTTPVSWGCDGGLAESLSTECVPLMAKQSREHLRQRVCGYHARPMAVSREAGRGGKKKVPPHTKPPPSGCVAG